MIEVGEWSVVVGIATVLSPFWFVFLTDLDILLDNAVWRSFTMVEVGEWSIVVRVTRILSPLWFIFLLHILKVLDLMVVVMSLNTSGNQKSCDSLFIHYCLYYNFLLFQ